MTAKGSPLPLTGEVRECGGMPTLFLNGKPDPGLMHWNRRPTPEDVAVFRDSGIHLFSFMGTLPIREAPDIPASYADGLAPVPELTDEFLDATLAMFETADPRAAMLIRFRITTPVWWRERHPERMIRYYDIETGKFDRAPHASISDPEWLELVRRAIADRVEYLEAKWGHRVWGYHPGLCCCAENAYTWGNAVADYSAPHLAAFRRRLERQYPSIAALNAAWHGTFRTFDEVEFPDPAMFLGTTAGDASVLLDPETQQAGADFMRFNSEAMADAVVFQARAVKNALRRLGRKKICGAFYGYANLPANQTDTFCAGHHAHEAVLDSPDIDMLCAPIGYSERNPGGCAVPQALPGSIALHGKLYYAEEDTRYHLARDRNDCVSGSERETADLMLRNFLDAWRSGGAIWWMDLFGEGWYRDPWFRNPLRKCREFAAPLLASRESTAQIAFFVSDLSPVYERAVPVTLSGALVEQQLEEMAACGAPCDLFRLEDLPLLAASGRLPQYRLAVVTNAYAIGDALRKTIDETLKKDGRTVLWLAFPGIVREGKLSAEAVSDLTGIRLTAVHTRNSLLTETWPGGRRTVYGLGRNIAPHLVSADPEAETLGWFVQGVDSVCPGRSNGGALAARKFAEWRSVWSASPGIPAELIGRMAGQSGVHIYSRHGDQVFAASGWFGIASKSTGSRLIFLPGKRTVRDAFTGEPVAENADRFRLRMKRGECRLFLLAEAGGVML